VPSSSRPRLRRGGTPGGDGESSEGFTIARGVRLLSPVMAGQALPSSRPGSSQRAVSYRLTCRLLHPDLEDTRRCAHVGDRQAVALRSARQTRSRAHQRLVKSGLTVRCGLARTVGLPIRPACRGSRVDSLVRPGHTTRGDARGSRLRRGLIVRPGSVWSGC
jgi:hypothetical protein